MIKEENLHHNWKLIQIKDCCELVMGQSPPGSSYNEKGEGMPFLQGKAEFGKHFPRHVKFTTDPKRKTKKGSILMSVRAPVGDVNIANIDYCIGRGLASLNLKNGDNKYLFYLLNYLKPKIEESGTGSTFKAITKSGLEKIKIPIPPLETQKRIVEILEKAEKLKEWRFEADELADEYLKSLFLSMYGDPGKNPYNWDIIQMEDGLDLITYGLTVRPEYISNGVPLISAREIRSGYVNFTDAPTISENDFNDLSDKGKPNKGDLLFSKTGAIGHCAVIETNEDFAITQNTARLVFKKELIESDFALFYLRSTYIQTISRHLSKGNAVKDLQLKDIKKFPLFLPPLDLQKKFAQIVQQVETLKIHQAQSKQEIDNLFNTLMQKAFKGELIC